MKAEDVLKLLERHEESVTAGMRTSKVNWTSLIAGFGGSPAVITAAIAQKVSNG